MRKQINAALLGTNGTGKTTWLLKLIKAYLKINKRVLICISDDGEEKLEDIPLLETIEQCLNFKGVAKIIVEDAKFFNEFRELFLIKKNRKFDGVLVLDDARLFLSQRDEALLKLMRKRRQLNADIYSIFHNFDGETPPSYWSFVTRAIIFKTLSSYNRSLKLINEDSRKLLISAIEQVSEEYKTNPYAFKEVVLRNEYSEY